MALTSSSVHIAAPVERVMGAIRDLSNYPKWTDGISDVEILELDDKNLPMRASFTISGGPISDKVELAYAWGSDFAKWHLLKGKTITALEGTYRIREDEFGCVVTYELSAEISISLPSFIKAAGEKTIVTTALQGLKDYLQ